MSGVYGFLFQVYPYVCFTVFLVGSLVRFDQNPYTWKSDSSQMLRAGIPFSNAPGLAYEYSNYGFAILGRIVANVSKLRYSEYVSANILRPLGMTSAGFGPPVTPRAR